jgi:uncharacterized protein (DUF1778 family)
MWKEEKVNYRHVLEIKKLIETAAEIGTQQFVSGYITNMEDY